MLHSSVDRTASILPALVSFGLLNHKDVVASKATNSRLVILSKYNSNPFLLTFGEFLQNEKDDY